MKFLNLGKKYQKTKYIVLLNSVYEQVQYRKYSFGGLLLTNDKNWTRKNIKSIIWAHDIFEGNFFEDTQKRWGRMVKKSMKYNKNDVCLSF